MKAKFTFLLLLLPAIILYCIPVQAQVISALAGNGTGATTGVGGYSGDGGPAYLAELSGCSGVTFDGAGNLYIADQGNNVIRKVAVSGFISTFAGVDTTGYSGDGGPAVNARFNRPHNVATDIWGNVYISDYGNNVIRMVNPSGMITTVAGSGAAGYSGDGGPATAARMNGPEGLTVDNDGNLYIAEVNNHIVRVVYADGTISTIAGNGTPGYSGNGGPALAAQLFSPTGVAIDVYGNLYIADVLNNVVRRVDSLGIIRNFAGNGTAGYSGNGGAATAAQLHTPSGISIYGFGDVYITDQANNAIRKVNTSGVISTFAGTTTNGYSGDGGLAVNAELSGPRCVSVNSYGRVFVADHNNNVIRAIGSNTATNQLSNTAATGIKVYPNPSKGSFNVELPASTDNITLTLVDMLGNVVATKSVARTLQIRSTDISGLPAGNYILKVTTGDQQYRQQVTVW